MSEKKRVEAITSTEEDFAQWYTDVVTKAELSSYSPIAGMMVVRPYGTAIWESIQAYLDARFKETGHENVMMPMLMPESFLEKEKDHIEGFAPEVAWVTYGGDTKLNERLCIRPTSEVLFADHYAQVIESHRDLPKLYNQWCSVLRWEKSYRPFLRTREFWWQEGHTAHATPEEAKKETMLIADIYKELCEEFLAMPVRVGYKTELEKFAGAEFTVGLEAMMKDGKALQSGTTHYFGDGFAKVFDIQFTNNENKLEYVYQTSWGVSTRLIGAIIMAHGDDDGLVLPPRMAPIQTMIVPIFMDKEGVKEKANEMKDALKAAGIRVAIDESDKSSGWKFAEWEMKGVPIRLEIGPRDIENNQCILARRDTSEKKTISLDNIENEIETLLEDIHINMYETVKKHMDENTTNATNMDELTSIFENENKFVHALWCGNDDCELAIKDEISVTSRCIPLDSQGVTGSCVYCGKESTKNVLWGKAY